MSPREIDLLVAVKAYIEEAIHGDASTARGLAQITARFEQMRRATAAYADNPQLDQGDKS